MKKLSILVLLIAMISCAEEPMLEDCEIQQTGSLTITNKTPWSASCQVEQIINGIPAKWDIHVREEGGNFNGDIQTIERIPAGEVTVKYKLWKDDVFAPKWSDKKTFHIDACQDRGLHIWTSK